MFYASCIDFNLSKYFRLKAKPDLPKLNIDEETDLAFVCLVFCFVTFWNFKDSRKLIQLFSISLFLKTKNIFMATIYLASGKKSILLKSWFVREQASASQKSAEESKVVIWFYFNSKYASGIKLLYFIL